ncbi:MULTISPECIES: hypothetical protein [Streptomyces]|uniref:hypothetical protein n=1 Tax=Streptomyces TaxID=1883 RepID=UPI00332CD5C3
MFDELPFHSLRGLVPIALSMERVKTLKARVTRLEKAASSGLLTIAEEETTQAVGGEELGFFIDRARKRQKWAMPLWVAPTHVAAAKSEPAPPSLSEEQALLDQLEAEAAHSVGLDAEALSRLRTKFRVSTNELAREEQRILRQAATRLARVAASTARTKTQSRAAHLTDVYVTVAREPSERFSTSMAADILDAPDTARQAIDRERRIREETVEAASALPGGKLQQMCEVDYLQLVGDQVAEALHGIGHRVQSKRMVVLTPAVSEETAQTVLQQLVNVFGDTCVLLKGIDGVAIRIPRPSQFGISLRRARSCDCGRHPVYGPDGAEL